MELIKKNKNLPDTLSDLTKFVLIGREKLVSVRAEIRAIDKIGMAKEVREQKKEEAQDLAGALLDAEVRMGELLKDIPKEQGRRTDMQLGSSSGTKLKLKNIGLSRTQSHTFQQLAANPEIVEQVKAEALENEDLPTRTDCINRIKQKQKDERIDTEKQARGKSVSSIEIRKGDFKKVLDDVYDIDAIITDPPYPKEFIECFSDLSLYAKTHLKEKGWLAVYSGQYNLPEVIERLSEHLTYVWTFCLYHVGKKQLVNGVNIMCGWKPILIFSKGHKKMRFSVYDVIESLQREKHSHEWQQSESGVLKLIEAFSEPGQLIVDPFSGSGTFCKIAIKNGRRAIGAELND